eukprot:GHVN01050988.1.p1 GENE.GHVN01050988.1~~GHVN01050988.1.p1  ORF type:complete len:130 (-),score=1.76 GHVN01050988.1:648-1037(-)
MSLKTQLWCNLIIETLPTSPCWPPLVGNADYGSRLSIVTFSGRCEGCNDPWNAPTNSGASPPPLNMVMLYSQASTKVVFASYFSQTTLGILCLLKAVPVSIGVAHQVRSTHHAFNKVELNDHRRWEWGH